MEKPIISLVASAIRTQHWLDLYEKLSTDNTIPFEIVFVGHMYPDFVLPENFIYIYSEAEAIECYETAYRNSKGEYVSFFADDIVPSSHFLNEMCAYLRRMWNDKVVLLPRLAFEYDPDARDGKCTPPLDSCMVAQLNNPEAPVVGACFTIKRSLWKELGGLDRRFTHIWSDLDMQLRIYEAGGCPFVSPTTIVWERAHTEHPRLSVKAGAGEDNMDVNFFNKCWLDENRILLKKRLIEFQPFTDDEIPIVR